MSLYWRRGRCEYGYCCFGAVNGRAWNIWLAMFEGYIITLRWGGFLFV